MANSTTTLTAAYAATAGTVTHVSMHTGDPGATGANEVVGGTYGRVARVYGAETAGAGDLAAPAVFAIPAGVTVTHWGTWAGSVFRFGGALAEEQGYTVAGAYTLSSAPYGVADEAA